MASKKISANGTSHTAAEIEQWYNENKTNIENYAKARSEAYSLRDANKSVNKNISTIDKESLKTYFSNIGSNERNLRTVSKYLYYRSNIYNRIVGWYASMFDLRCRKVTPPYSLTKNANAKKMLKAYDSTLEMLDRMNMQGNMHEVLTNVFVNDVCYAVKYLDDTGMFFYVLDPDECIIDGRYNTGDYSFSINMANWKSAQKRIVMEYLGEPFKSMYREYENTGKRYIHCPDKYAACFKFRTDTWDMVAPPFLSLFLQIAGNEDLVDIQGEADALSIYKLVYMPMKTLSGTKNSDDFEISPDLAHKYFNRMTQEALPDGVAAAMVPGDELKVVDFAKSVDEDITSVEKASNQILQTGGGGAVINANKITTNAGFEAWLKSETEFAVSPLIPQINGFVNRTLITELGNNACKVEHFEVSVYTRINLRKVC